jgi:D-alanyl-D-alanine carboxypeptidase, serine-type, PBP4 family
MPYSRERYLSGSVPCNKGTFGLKGDLPNPGLLLAQHLTERLREAGVKVTRDAGYEIDYSNLAPQRTVLYTHRSPSLRDLVKETNVNSNNLYAEAIFRYLGARYTKPGNINSSQGTIRDFWQRKGVDIGSAIIKDGCGLAPQDAVSAKTFVQVLTYMSSSKNKEAWMASLPISGQTGTLKTLCQGTPLEGRIHAKSGTIAGTKNFAGYIDMPNGETWVFAILINSAPGKARNIQNIIQEYLLDVCGENR